MAKDSVDPPGQEKQYYEVDNEQYAITDRELTVESILVRGDFVPPSDFYLLEFHGEGRELKHEELTEVIRLHHKMRFAAVFRGATPVS